MLALFLLVPLGVLIMESVEFHFPQNWFGLVLAAYFSFFHLPRPSKVNKLSLRGMGSPSIKLQSNDVSKSFHLLLHCWFWFWILRVLDWNKSGLQKSRWEVCLRGELPFEKVRDACGEIWIEPLTETNLGVAQALLAPLDITTSNGINLITNSFLGKEHTLEGWTWETGRSRA